MVKSNSNLRFVGQSFVKVIDTLVFKNIEMEKTFAVCKTIKNWKIVLIFDSFTNRGL